VTEPDELHRLLLSVSEAANARLDLAGVLEAVMELLEPLVPLDAMAVAQVDGDRIRPHGIHVRGLERRAGEAPAETLARAGGLPADAAPAIGQGFLLRNTGTAHVGQTGRAYVCQDVEAERRFAEDERLRSFGFRAYVRTPLFVRGRLIGSVAFARRTTIPFGEEEVQILEEVSRPIASAVANSLAYEQIAGLKNQLQAENVALREEIDERFMFEEIVGSSRALRQLIASIEKVAPTDSTVLITGETGTGKELIARAIHRRSKRATRAMIAVNSAALPAGLVASELFGHERGAFTGALQQRTGRFELAMGGTLFLDEVGDLPPDVQGALLRVLQRGEFERVGGTRTLTTDARLIAATNRDLQRAVAGGGFRSDLFYRLNVFPIAVPPLRERREDIPVLVEYFVGRHAKRQGKKFERIDRRTMDLLTGYDWPGNVRELENVLERSVILAEGGTLRVDGSVLGAGDPPATRESGGSTLREQEKQAIEQALRAARGRVAGPAGAAARLGIPATTLESKIKRLGIDKFRFHATS
jgi:formate hydrogenlyase transcriptional activator